MALSQPARRKILLALATIFSLATMVYTATWMYYIRHQSPLNIGMTVKLSKLTGQLEVIQVWPDTAAARAGFQAGDVILEVNHRAVETLNPWAPVGLGRPGDLILFAVRHKGSSNIESLPLTLERAPVEARVASWPQVLAEQVLDLYPLPFLVVAVVVLFLRVEDRNAWLLAWMFAGFIASAPLVDLEAFMPSGLRGFAIAYMVLFYGTTPAMFYWFFAVFPTQSPIDRRVPWLKKVMLFLSLAITAPLAFWILLADSSRPLWVTTNALRQYGLRTPTGLSFFQVGYGILPFVLGLASFAWNTVSAPTPEARRKTRVMLWGMIIGLTPIMVLGLISILSNRAPSETPFWEWAIPIMALFLIPLTFAYAVVKYRVLEIPVLLKRSARYVLVRRGFALLVIVLALAANAGFTLLLSRLTSVGTPLAASAGVGFGLVLAWVSAPALKRSTDRIDRAFFRGSYDARMILQDLAEKARTVSSRQELAGLLSHYLEQALHPSRMFVYLEHGDRVLHTETENTPSTLSEMSAESPELNRLARDGKVRELWGEREDAELQALLAPLRPECVVPIQGRGAGLIGLVVLGTRLSEEPYSGEDRRLLGSVASQAGVALENISLAEGMANRIETERKVEQEMKIAREVQRRLLPQDAPALRTLEYAGQCVQARAVGGDYYDFLELAPGHVGFVVADISGKGISGALLMANLQANLRSQYAVALTDLPRLLQSVNRLFYKNTEENRYATLFFAAYDDASRRLRYVNCGHNPPLLVRADQKVESLQSTATVVGLFEEWQCTVQETLLHPGDTLIIYTDGVVEAENASGQEFGGSRLQQAVLQAWKESPVEMLQRVIGAVQTFSPGEQGDDITLLVARTR
jgi:sigma-B regulation protein RsbU (phosphoserine phosphatase)